MAAIEIKSKSGGTLLTCEVPVGTWGLQRTNLRKTDLIGTDLSTLTAEQAPLVVNAKWEHTKLSAKVRERLTAHKEMTK